jgi:hypothetical protein
MLLVLFRFVGHFMLLPVMAVDILASHGASFIWKDLRYILVFAMAYFVLNLSYTKVSGEPVYP